MKIFGSIVNKSKDNSTEHNVNPVYDTAKSCLVNLAKAGCREAILLNGKLNFSEDVTANNSISKGVALFQEARYRFVNSQIEKSGCKNILDIGCGYSPRGILFSQKGFNYIGADLPAVVREMKTVTEEDTFCTATCKFSYKEVDATNPASLVEAAKDLQGSLCIITEGMFMYFPIYELQEYIKGLKELLAINDGCLITPDFAMNKLLSVSASATSGKILGNILQKAASSIVKGYTYKTENEMDPSVWYADESDEKPYKFFSESGFNIERVPICDETIELESLKNLKPRVAKKLVEAYKSIYGWKITLKS